MGADTRYLKMIKTTAPPSLDLQSPAEAAVVTCLTRRSARLRLAILIPALVLGLTYGVFAEVSRGLVYPTLDGVLGSIPIGIPALLISVAGALMPDAHQGYGLPIGGVLATADAVIPYAVGVDIACRMRMTVLYWPIEALRKKREELKRAIEQETRFGVGAAFRRPRQHAVMDEDWAVTKVTAHLKAQIGDGAFAEGRIPPETELAADLGVSRTTVRDALSRLEHEGAIYRRQGSGTFVNPQGLQIRSRLEEIWAYEQVLEDHGYTPSVRVLAMRTEPATDEDAEALEVEPGTPLLVMDKLFLEDDVPVVLTSNRIPRDRVDHEAGADEAAEPIYLRAVREFFRPEFFNRLDRIVAFTRLDRTELAEIARSIIADHTRRLCLLLIRYWTISVNFMSS